MDLFSLATAKKLSGDGGVPPTGTLSISVTSNGTTTEDVSEYANAEITVNTLPEKGLVFEDYDSDGYPHSARLVGMTEIPSTYCYNLFYNSNILNKIRSIDFARIQTVGTGAFTGANILSEIRFPDNDITLGIQAFRNCSGLETLTFYNNVTFISNGGNGNHFDGCSNLTHVSFGGHVSHIPNRCFASATKCDLYDFSHCTAIPTLYSVASLGHADGCVIRIPAALSDTTLGTGNGWESATNWNALTNIVWEVV